MLKEFAMLGSLLDMAVGIILGVAFGSIISSLVNDIITPPIGLLLGGIDFANLFITLRGGPFISVTAAKAAGAPTISYGIFIKTVINFIIIAFVVFLVVRQVNRMQRKPGAPPDDEAVPVLLVNHPAQGGALPELYV